MDLEAYFAMILLILSAVAFITLALIFLYMIYGKEEETKQQKRNHSKTLLQIFRSK